MPFPYRCLSRKCRESGNAAHIQYFEEVEREVPLPGSTCGYCKKTDKLVRLSVIHLLVPAQDGENFDVKGSFADHNWKFACPVGQTRHKEGGEMFYTVDKEGTTCHCCLEAVKSGVVKLEYNEE